MKVQDTKAVVSYFRGEPKFGRTTTLVEKTTGRTLFVGMGICTRAELWDAMRDREKWAEAAAK